MNSWGLIATVPFGTIVGVSAAAAAVGGALVGLFFRGAATAWREERDAAVDKAERLEETVAAQATQIDKLELKVSALEKKTDYEAYAERSASDHRQILQVLSEQSRSIHASTVAIEFLIKQAFPSASLAFPAAPDVGADERSST